MLNSLRNSSSEIILIPSSLAFLFLPEEEFTSLLISASVLADTLPATLPPLCSMISFKASRFSNFSSEPVITKVFPIKSFSTSDTIFSISMYFKRLSISFILFSFLKNLTIPEAMTSPT